MAQLYGELSYLTTQRTSELGTRNPHGAGRARDQLLKLMLIGGLQPALFGLGLPSTFWVPITMQQALEPARDLLSNDNLNWLALFGRPRRGATMEEVHADLA